MTDWPRTTITPLDVVWFLTGHRDAIVNIAQTPAALAVGAVFVLSAGLAREYDGEDLRAEPQHLLIPFFASLVTSILLFTGIYFALRLHGGLVTGYCSLYARFLAAYWMTAPLAWLYALPVERWFSAAVAVKANLWLLAVVSAWRVILMIRIVMVMFGAPFEDAFSLVGAFAATVTAVAAWTMPTPIINVMGGVRFSEKEELISRVMSWVRGLSTLAAPALWAIAALCIESPLKHWSELTIARTGAGIHLSLWAVAAASVGVWFWLARGPQREQRLRRLVESAFRSGDIDRALEIMSSHKQTEFPPHWDPPPRHAYRLFEPRMIDVVDAIGRGGAARWVTDIYDRKLGYEFDRVLNFVLSGPDRYLGRASLDEVERLIAILEQVPTARKAAVESYIPDIWLFDLNRQDFDRTSVDANETERRFGMYQRLLAILREYHPPDD